MARLEKARKDIVDDVNISIGAACEELSASANEILRQASGSCELAGSVVRETRHASDSAHELTDLAENINSVVKLITELAEATNMLALNASIEAAHAGVHGQGFAVVAGGVKQLSRDTRDATTTISERVAAIHQGVNSVRGAIDTIASSVDSLERNATSINASVNEQVLATEEISRRIADMVEAMSTEKSAKTASIPMRESAPASNGWSEADLALAR
jgi:methyl-accepting chemotaxis protein